ncbi:MAG: ethanolamine ammonia-lyase reactivating factor EutA [Oscillospiraceae bacterium]|nr:ethanolamine ammonia-lyase reactivating factor EutA [Oscillospiraceae bacterium]
MAESLLSVGIDVGTTTTQLVVSRITVENRASGFCVPEMDITNREILYESEVAFTPLVGENLVDGGKIAEFVEEEYRKAGIKPTEVDTGAVIVTGETSRKENAAAVLQSLAGLAGEFVVATAGPDLESILAAKGAGAVAYSQRTGKNVLHMDIGGGTSNLCYIRDGEIAATGCLNVGGRLVKVEDGRISYVSTVVESLWAAGASPRPTGRMEVGEGAEVRKLEALADVLVQGLEMAAGLREKTPLWDALWTQECGEYGERIATPVCGLARNDVDFRQGRMEVGDRWVVSFSGGVADCIREDFDSFAFGDMGPILGRAIRKSRLCRGEYMLGEHTIRATVIGAGCHSAQLSGSTVFCRDVALPLKNLTVAAVPEDEQTDAGSIARRLAAADSGKAVLALPGYAGAGYAQVAQLADAVLEGFGDREILVCIEQDLAKALGQMLFLRSGKPCLCIDRVRLPAGSYLDVGVPVGPCFPVVVKTLILNG